MDEVIVAAAIRTDTKTYSVPKPGRHHDVIRVIAHSQGHFDHASVQGFLTDTGRFVDRKQAADIAMRSGQITQLKWPPNLYSEDLW